MTQIFIDLTWPWFVGCVIIDVVCWGIHHSKYWLARAFSAE